MTRRVLVVQELLPHYRTEFFQRLIDRLAVDGVELTLVHGHADAERAARADAGQFAGAAVVRNRSIGLGSKRLVWQPVLRLAGGCDLVIVEQANRLLVNYPLFGWSRAGGPRLALWTHGRNWQSRRPDGVRERWKRWWLHRPYWWFAYTDAVAVELAAAGCPPARITVVQNSIRPACPDGPIAEKVPGRCVFVGSMYDDKRLDILLAAADQLATDVPGFSLHVIGAGPRRDLFSAAAGTRPWLRVCGPLRDNALAVELSAAQLTLCPGLVGLAVIEAFAAEAPMVTIDWAHHSPEVTYLRTGNNGIVLPAGSEATDYAGAVAATLADAGLLNHLRDGCRQSRQELTLDAMVDNFATGVLGALK